MPPGILLLEPGDPVHQPEELLRPLGRDDHLEHRLDRLALDEGLPPRGQALPPQRLPELPPEPGASRVERDRRPELGDRFVEAAAAMGTPVGTVRSRLHYALKYLREALEADARLERNAGTA